MEFLELTFSRHDTCNLLCDTSHSLARSSPTRRFTGLYEYVVIAPNIFFNDIVFIAFSFITTISNVITSLVSHFYS